MRRDYTEVLRKSCDSILTAVGMAENALSRWPDSPQDQPAVDRSLVKMMLALHRAEGLILPPPDAMEYFGLPRSATASAFDPDPTIRVQDPARETWDFRPWLSEKLTRVREHLHALMEVVETALDEVNGMDGWSCAPVGAGPAADQAVSTYSEEDRPSLANTEPPEEPLAERLQERALYELRAARTYTRTILSAIDTMGLTVIDWRLAGRP